MTDVTNYVGSKTQTRSFVYSSLGRLVSATNPELDCAVAYLYYPNGALRRKSGCGPSIDYKVDGLSRVTKKDYSGAAVATPGARFCYDGRK